MILDHFSSLARRLADELPAPGDRLPVRELPGVSAAALAAALGRATGAPVVLAATDPSSAEALFSDLGALGLDTGRATGEGGGSSRRPRAGYFPQRESLPHEDRDPHVEIVGERIQTLAALLGGRLEIVVTTGRGLVERSAMPAADGGFGLELEEGDEIGRAGLVDRLAGMGFERVHTVRELGEFAVRGGIVDLFPFGSDSPVRVELWGDRIESLRRFDLLTQRSVEEVSRLEVLPVQLTGVDADESRSGNIGGGRNPSERRALLEILPDTTLLIDRDPAGNRGRRERLWEEVSRARRQNGAGALPPEALVIPPPAADDGLARLRRLVVTEGEPDDGAALDLELEPPPPIHRDMGRLIDVLAGALQRDDGTLVLCDNQGQMERLEEILEERGGTRLARDVTLALGSVSGGFRMGGDEPLLVLTDHEIFERAHHLRRTHRVQGTPTLESIASLKPGDYVVHLDHGIGRYRGLERVEIGGEAIETLRVEYADGEMLRVPHYRLDLVERWSTASDGEPADPPRVHKLGGKRWRNLKQRTEDSIQEAAAEFLELYAHRQVADGYAFGEDTRWQREMESAFLYEETPDQLEAWEEVKADMQEPRPMDRLICGDVGYGKTEVAMRAAFKSVQESKQVAVLAPTTVLAEQHLHTFRERMAGFPVRIEALSRFRTGAEQKRVLKGLAAGEVDIVVGTHRLLSPDVAFHDLGLLIVDEEQRFGVRQKDRLADLKRSIDVLTLTATPIPRTMQLALGGLRDLSVIETAPRDRMPIITHVLRWSDPILQDAIQRELDRGGQVFFVHDRVQTIEALARRVRRLQPDATVAVAHGQMGERQLEETMARLMEGEIDILVSTSIIENGLDVPSANTMIVHRADRFGLAQLYQLRGRVGRSHRRAHCYLLVPSNVSPEAEDRLRVLEHHTELGSGYQVALKDLELRGAGNLLGARQSGFAQAVGYETYRRMLERTVEKMKGSEAASREPPKVSIEGDAYLPDDYILDSEQKMHLYRRISRTTERREVETLREELRDRFGPLPDPADRLLAALELKILGTSVEAEWIRVAVESARVNFRSEAVPRMALLKNAFHEGQLDVEVRRAQPLSLVLEQAGVEPLLPTLVRAFRVLNRTEEVGTRAPEASHA